MKQMFLFHFLNNAEKSTQESHLEGSFKNIQHIPVISRQVSH